MKPDYKNWMPKGLVNAIAAGTAVVLALFLLFAFGVVPIAGTARLVLSIIFGIGTAGMIFYLIWTICLYRAFDYNGRRQMSRQIIEGVADHVKLPDGGRGLDVGCGSGALAIACAKRNPKASMLGVDRWGKEYASFNKPLCENNAKAEGVSNVSFQPGNAIKLDFPDETFDAVTSNYVYHNITGQNKQELLLETLRVLKKGGTFAIHDIMTESRYGDMKAFVKKLQDMGYEKVELIDTSKGMFMSEKEGKWMGLAGSTLLLGVK
ncbi:MAG: methyltransferase domain-containing protein [Eubacterium sp.]|nr:methyltransferase domain-containing protein [Eubacterium sp.]